jgi:hypothetical protein
MLETIIALIGGFAAGYGLREWIPADGVKRRSVGGMPGIKKA